MPLTLGRVPCNLCRFFQRISQLLPALKAALQRPDTFNPELLQLLCHPGTRGFIGSSAVKDNVAVVR